MAKLSVEEVLAAVAEWSVMELSEFIKAAEEKFGVSAAAPVAMAAAMPAAATGEDAAAEEEQTEFNVILKSIDDSKKIPIIREVRALTSLGLKEAKELVEAGGKAIKEGVSKEEAKTVKEKLEAAGAVIELQ